MAEFGVFEWLVALAIFLVGAAAMWHADRVQEKGFDRPCPSSKPRFQLSFLKA